MQEIANNINLLKDQEPTFWEKFLGWSLTAGRFIIITTEAIALAAFLYRFTIDWQLSDLHTKIKQQQKIVTYLKKNEDTYRDLQNRLAETQKLSVNNTQKESLVKRIVTLAQNRLVFKTLSVSNSTVSMEARVRSVTSLNQFLQAMRDSQAVDSISLDSLANQTTSSQLIAKITVNLKQTAGVKTLEP